MQIFFPATLLDTLSPTFSLLPALYNFIQLVTQIIDVMAIAIVLISVIQAIKPFLSYIIRPSFRSSSPIPIEDNGKNANNTYTDAKSKRLMTNNAYNSSKKSFVKSLFLALELESGNAILKMGIFTAASVGLNPIFQAQTLIQALGGNFLFFVVILSLRIAINQTLRRFS